MSDQEKKPETQEGEPVPSEETPPVVEQPAEEKSPQDSEYEEQIQELTGSLEKRTADNDNITKALNEARDKIQKLKQQEGDTTAPEVDVEKLQKIVEDATAKQLNDFRTDMAVATFDEELDKIAKSEKERELLKQIYRTKIRPSGVDRKSIRSDLLLAKAGANLNHLKFDNQPNFDAKMVNAMGTVSGKQQYGSEPSVKLSADEERLLRLYGADPKEAAKKIAEM